MPILKIFKPKLNAALAALFLAASVPLWADGSTPLQQAKAAYQSGDYEQALRL